MLEQRGLAVRGAHQKLTQVEQGVLLLGGAVVLYLAPGEIGMHRESFTRVDQVLGVVSGGGEVVGTPRPDLIAPAGPGTPRLTSA